MVKLCIFKGGEKVWYLIRKNGKSILHRVNGPAIVDHEDKDYFQNGKRHRLDGPAIELWDGRKFWYYQDQEINCSTQEEFDRLIKLKILW